MPFVLSVKDHRELQAVVLAMGRLERDVKNQINRTTRAVLAPVWTDELNAKLRTPMDRLTLGAGVRVKPGNPPVVLAAQSTRPVRSTRPGGRIVPADQWAGWEFGATGDDVKTYTRRTKKGRSVNVRRHTERQMPPRYRAGRVAFPALAATAPRMAAAWVQTVVRAVHDAAEGKTS